MIDIEQHLPKSIDWINGRIRFIDQRLLPFKEQFIETDDWRVIERAIKRLSIRGAPLIGVAAGLAVAAEGCRKKNRSDLRKSVQFSIDRLRATRPTAVNLFWVLDSMQMLLGGFSGDELVSKLEETAIGIMDDDRQRCKSIGENGASLLNEGSSILTLCNTGWLATAGIGTALGIIYTAHFSGKRISVYACETRPLLQGARLTMWELKKVGVRTNLIVDSASGYLIGEGQIDCCVIGADRIASNGDTANKIGSRNLAIACNYSNVPFYVAAPESTVDRSINSSDGIIIEKRDENEVLYVRGKRISASGITAYNPAFDVVPAELISAIVTERGVYRPPYRFV